MSNGDMTERELDEALAAITKRKATAERVDILELLEAEAVAEESATPWRDATPWNQRYDLRVNEAALAHLYMTRMGEGEAECRRRVENLCREAWWSPRGAVPSTDARLASVNRALSDEMLRVARLPKLVGKAKEAAPPRHPSRKVAPGQLVEIREVQRRGILR